MFFIIPYHWDCILSKFILKLLQVVPALFEISHLLLIINCSLNFPIYFLAGGTKFCKTRRNNNRSQSYKTTSFQMNNLRSLSLSWRENDCTNRMTELWNIYFDVKSISKRTNSCKNPEFGDTFLTDLICLRAWASLMSLCCICNKHTILSAP